MAPPPDNAPPESNNSTPPPSDDSGNSTSPPSSTPPPEKSPPSPPPPSSPPPSSPSSPPPSSPPPKNDSPSPPSPNSNSSSSAKPPSSSSAPPPSPTPNASPPPPSTNNSAPAPPGLFSPPPPIADKAGSPPREPAHKVPSSSSSTPSDSSDSSPSSHSSSDGPNATVIAVVVVGGVLLLSLVVVCLIFMRRKNKEKTYYMDPMRGPPKGGHGDYYHGNQQWNNSPADHIVKLPPQSGGGGWGPPPPNNSSDSSNFSGSNQSPSIPNMGLGFSKSQFSYEELASATSGFSQANLLGQGGFGYVHKGVLPNGQEVAVKSLKSGSGQGEREFQAEVEIISRVHHRHLVSLVGYCIANEQRMLVYEFVPNSTLEFHLYGKGRPVMDWETRLRIALGSARGLAYLHEDCHPRIIHRDIKAANILLDNNFEAMVADFGLAKLSSDNFTHVSTRVMGTFGYLAPEYASSGKLTEKSDVFSFGVMLLELITGRKPVDPTSKYMDDSLVDWARPLMTRVLEDGNFDELVDPRLEDNFNPQEMTRMVASAAASIRHSARRRPKMSQIVRTLEGNASLDDLNDGGLKASQSSTILGTTQAYDTGAYNADMVKFRKMVLSTEEFPSAEHGRTSDH